MSAGRHRLLPVVDNIDERTKTGMGRDAVSVVCCGVDEHCVGRRMKKQHAALDVPTTLHSTVPQTAPAVVGFGMSHGPLKTRPNMANNATTVPATHVTFSTPDSHTIHRHRSYNRPSRRPHMSAACANW